MQDRGRESRAFEQREFEREQRPPPALQRIGAGDLGALGFADGGDLGLRSLGLRGHRFRPFLLGGLHSNGGGIRIGRLDRGLHGSGRRGRCAQRIGE